MADTSRPSPDGTDTASRLDLDALEAVLDSDFLPTNPSKLRALIARARRADELEAERADLIAIAEWVAHNAGPSSFICRACHSWNAEGADHEPDCVWVLARKVTGR